MEAAEVRLHGWTPDSSKDLDLFTQNQHCGPPGVAGDPLNGQILSKRNDK